MSRRRVDVNRGKEDSLRAVAEPKVLSIGISASKGQTSPARVRSVIAPITTVCFRPDKWEDPPKAKSTYADQVKVITEKSPRTALAAEGQRLVGAGGQRIARTASASPERRGFSAAT